MNTHNDILYNMYKGGVLKLEEEGIIYTSDNQYVIKLKREQKGFFSQDTNYVCNISIYDKITNNLVLSIDNSIKDIMILLDNFTTFLEWYNRDLIIPPLTPYNSTGCYYFFRLCGNETILYNGIVDDLAKSFVIINEYNPLNEQVVERVKLEFADDYELQQFMDTMYFVFLIDIEDEISREEVIKMNEQI